MSFCKVYGCRFPTTHITSFHFCGKCNSKGHGMTECGNLELIAELSKDTTEIPFNLMCCALNCRAIITHTIEGHKCTYCSTFGHDVSECPDKLWNVRVERGTTFGCTKDGFMQESNLQLQARKQLAWEEHEVYTKIFGEMGSIWYARRDNNFEKVELFLMHSDNWGQYGPTTDDRPKLNKFLEGYRCVDN